MMDTRPAGGQTAHGEEPTANPARRGIGGDQPGAEIRGLSPLRRVAVVDAAVGGTGRIGRPMRRSEPLDAAAFLVHEHRRFAPDPVANRRRQAAPLRPRLDVALEKNEPPRLALPPPPPPRGRAPPCP